MEVLHFVGHQLVDVKLKYILLHSVNAKPSFKLLYFRRYELLSSLKFCLVTDRRVDAMHMRPPCSNTGVLIKILLVYHITQSVMSKFYLNLELTSYTLGCHIFVRNLTVGGEYG